MGQSTVPEEIEKWAEGDLAVRPDSFVREFAGGSRPLWYAESAVHGPVVVRLEPPGGGAASTICESESLAAAGRRNLLYPSPCQPPGPGGAGGHTRAGGGLRGAGGLGGGRARSSRQARLGRP